ncbi:MAG: patatin-like phospholipase family protein [Thermoleophilaceae bacterium]|nr:patatin-like phospholipase family protein [Thermoleophilaceae bacterium]
MAERIRVLSIDGGGIRGIIPALVLAELERRAGRPVADLFDLVAGTSTGGILALALAQPGRDGRPARTAEELVELYETEGPRIFARDLLQRIRSVEGLADERYSAEGLDRALKRYLGDTRLPDALTPVLVTAYDTAAREAVLLSRDDDLAMRDAARATAAAPTYFEALEPPGRRT